MKRREKPKDVKKPTKDPGTPAAAPTEGMTGISLLDRFLQLQEAQDKDLQMRMGDASIAAPFTVRASNVKPVLDIVRQGRCTLVTTLQMYFILALNGLITAFSLSALHLSGVRVGDAQMTTMALFTAGSFFFISRAKPLEKLAAVKPGFAIFTRYFFASLLGQFASHLGCLLAVRHFALQLTPGGFVPPGPNDSFAPNIVNSCVFLVSSSMTLTTFAVNYQGHPFMQSLMENQALMRCLGIGFAVLLAGALGVLTVPLQLVALPADLKSIVLALMFGDLGFCFAWEKLSALIFSKYSQQVVAPKA